MIYLSQDCDYKQALEIFIRLAKDIYSHEYKTSLSVTDRDEYVILNFASFTKLRNLIETKGAELHAALFSKDSPERDYLNAFLISDACLQTGGSIKLLCYACLTGNLDLAKFVMSKINNLNQRYFYTNNDLRVRQIQCIFSQLDAVMPRHAVLPPLMCAIYNSEIVECLLKAGADPNLYDTRLDRTQYPVPLSAIATDKQLDIDRYPVLFLAIAANQFESIKILIREKADSKKNVIGIIALMMAAAFGNSEIVEMLLSSGSEEGRSVAYQIAKTKFNELPIMDRLEYDKILKLLSKTNFVKNARIYFDSLLTQSKQ